MESLEVLIINDGSTDGSATIANKFVSAYPTVFRLIDKQNGNYGSCVNRGLSEAQGRYLKVLDADDHFDTQNFQQLLQLLNCCNVDCVISDMEQVKEDGSSVGQTNFNLPINTPFGLDALGDAAWNMWMHCVCYRTACLRAINYHQTEGISYTDQELIGLPMTNVRTLLYFPHIIYKYLVGRQGQTVNLDVWEKNFTQEIQGAKVMIEQERHLSPECSKAGHDYLRQRISRRVEVIYNAYFTKFRTYQMNDAMIDFDQYLKAYDLAFYHEQNRHRILRLFHYVTHWRKDYRPNTPYLNIVRQIARIMHNLHHHAN